MDSSFVECLNSVLPGFGTALLVLVVGGGLIIGFIKGVIKVKKTYDDHIKEKEAKENEEKLFREQMRSMVDTISAINNDVTNLQKMIVTDRESNKSNLEKLTNALTENQNDVKLMAGKVDKQGVTISLLLKSEMEDIRAFITTEYFRWTEVGFIDVNAAKTLNDRYESYLAADGDTFIAGFMDTLRNLPKKQCINPSEYFLYNRKKSKPSKSVEAEETEK